MSCCFIFELKRPRNVLVTWSGGIVVKFRASIRNTGKFCVRRRSEARQELDADDPRLSSPYTCMVSFRIPKLLLAVVHTCYRYTPVPGFCIRTLFAGPSAPGRTLHVFGWRREEAMCGRCFFSGTMYLENWGAAIENA